MSKPPLRNCPLTAPFAGRTSATPPIWLMRQAGRYLPEYRTVRTKAGSFLDLCYTPELAAEVTLQPIRRFGFDAAILFSDILIVPEALGQKVAFVEGEGPRLEPIATAADMTRLDPQRVQTGFARVFETVQRVRAALAPETALIGFCGAPWTVATYMIAGRGSADQAEARLWAYRQPETFGRLIDLLTDVSIEYLSGQAAHGADVLQLFDSWAVNLSETAFERWVIEPAARLVRALKVRHPHVPVIGFPRGAGANLFRYARETGVDGLGCDTGVPLSYMRDDLASAKVVLQGNLDPLALVAGGAALEGQVKHILAAMTAIPFIFNLGHGILPQTPVEHVSRLVELVRAQPMAHAAL
ncbi:MAG: uroporphyrinogen decarboxylase [Hyphomicrobiaceae bacterium]